MIIRPASSADIPALTGLLGILFSLEADFCPDTERQQAGLKLLLAAPEARCVLVAEEGDSVVGMVSGQLVISTAQGGPSVLVEDVIVSPHARGKGVGTSLMAVLTRWAETKGATRMQLLADRENTSALAFYARQGWQQTQLICLRSTMD